MLYGREYEAECERCGAAFTHTARTGGRGHRFCGKRCCDAAYRAARKPAEEPDWPQVLRELPPVPDAVILGGLCLQPAAGDYWVSDDPADREQARRICRVCSVQQVCLDWSLQLPSRDNAVYAGLNGYGRKKLRRERAAA